MKSLFCSLVLLCLSYQLYAQGSSNSASGNKTCTDIKGNVYVIGTFNATARFSPTMFLTTYGVDDIFVAKYDQKGNCYWAVNAGGIGVDAGKSIQVDENGYIYFTGSFTGSANFGKTVVNSTGASDFFLAKYNPSGDPVWVKTGKNKDDDWGNDLKIDAGKNIYVTGYYSNAGISLDKISLKGNGAIDMFVAKFNPEGEAIWAKNAGGKGDDVGNGITISNDGVYVTGFFSETATFDGQSVKSAGGQDLFIAKYKLEGDKLWVKNYGGSKFEDGNSVAVDNSGSLIFGGVFTDTAMVENKPVYGKADVDILIVKLDGSGNLQWMKTFGSVGDDEVRSVATDDKGGIFISGKYSDGLNVNGKEIPSSGGTDMILIKLNSGGNTEWVSNAGNDNSEDAKSVATDKSGNSYQLGNFHGTVKIGGTSLTSENHDVLLAKYNPAGKVEYAVKAIGIDPSIDATQLSKFVNYNAKLVAGTDKKNAIRDKTLKLVNDKGAVLQTTRSDFNGDFSFKGVNSGEPVNIALDKTETVPAGASLANEYGILVKDFANKGGENVAALSPADLTTVFVLEDPDHAPELKKFKSAKDQNEISLIEHINYEGDGLEIPKGDAKKIGKIVSLMQQIPTSVLDVTVYTDAKLETAASLELSNKRAAALVDFITKKGIKPPERIRAKGAGETNIMNRCVDGVECADKEHLVNNRVEFKLYKVAPPPEKKKK